MFDFQHEDNIDANIIRLKDIVADVFWGEQDEIDNFWTKPRKELGNISLQDHWSANQLSGHRTVLPYINKAMQEQGYFYNI
jgi:hypothetical protein